MYKSLFIFGMVLSPLTIQYVSGQFPGFSGAESGFPSFKLSGPLGQLMTGGLSGNGLRFMNSNLGFGQILGSLMSGTTSSNSGGPLQQLATAASTQYMNAIRSHPLLSQFTGGQTTSSVQQGPPPPAQHPYGAAPPPPPGMHHAAPAPPPPPGPHHHHQPMYSSMHNPMALLGGDPSSMYGPPSQPGYDSHFGGSSVFPQYTAPDSYFGGQYGPPAAPSHPMAAVYPPSYPHMPSPMHLDRK